MRRVDSGGPRHRSYKGGGGRAATYNELPDVASMRRRQERLAKQKEEAKKREAERKKATMERVVRQVVSEKSRYDGDGPEYSLANFMASSMADGSLLDEFAAMREQCANCGHRESEFGDLERGGDTKNKSKRLKKCSRCCVVAYCSSECQKAHWKVHKKQGCKRWDMYLPEKEE